jgi:hypothetical protein
MPRHLPTLVFLVAGWGCAPAAPEASPPRPHVGEPTASARAHAASASAPAPSGAPSSAPDPAPAPGAKGLPGWEDFPGPTVELPLAAGPHWCIVPVSGEWNVLMLLQLEYVRRAGPAYVFKRFDDEVAVPGALVRAGEPITALKPGAPVLAHIYDSLDAQYARVISVGETVKVRTQIVNDVEEHDVAPSRILPLSGQLALGEPVGYRSHAEGDWLHGQLVYAGKAYVLLLTGAGTHEQVAPSDVRPIDTRKRFKKGDAVRAEWSGWLKPATVVEVLHDGLLYKVRLDDGGREELDTFEEVAPAKGW